MKGVYKMVEPGAKSHMTHYHQQDSEATKKVNIFYAFRLVH